MLVTSKEYLTYRLGTNAAKDKIDDKRVEHFIAVAQSMVAQYCGRLHDVTETLETPSSTINEEFTGDDSAEYIVAQGRVSAASTPSLQFWNGSAWESHGGTLEVNAKRTAIRFTSADIFSSQCLFRLAYKPGFTAAEAPQHLKHTLCQLTHRLLLKADGKEGLETESFGDHATSYNLSSIPKDIAAQLDRYRIAIYG